VKILSKENFVRKPSLTTVVFASIGAVGALLLTTAMPSSVNAQAQEQEQVPSAVAAASSYEYEVSTIKPYKPGSGEGPGVIRMGIMNTADGFTASGVNLQLLLQQAYGVQPYQITGAPEWANSERFEIDAKMDSSVADALSKLSPEDRNLARLQMLQKLLADRFKLTIHRNTKELPAYTLVVGKNGSKLKEADPNAAPAPAAPVPGRGGRVRPGTMMMGFDSSEISLTGNAIPVSALAERLSQFLRTPVIDKTGLLGKYDITLKFAPEMGQLPPPPGGGAPDGMSPPPPSDPGGPTLQMAVQDQLGLKLESGKGPVELIVIEHVEKPSDN
jgi:uncharacterized protein (TIGR03435 family)